MVKIVPETGIKFLTYDKVKEYVCTDIKHPTVPERLISGAAAGFIS